MKSRKEVKVEFTLILSEWEVMWLRNYLQNKPNTEETPDNTKIREELFYELGTLLND